LICRLLGDDAHARRIFGILSLSLFTFLPLKSRPPLAISLLPASLRDNSYLRICRRSLNGQDLYRWTRVLCLANKNRSCIWAIRCRVDEFNDLSHGNSRERDTLFRVILAVSLTSGKRSINYDNFDAVATHRKLSGDRTLRWTLAILVRSALRGNVAAIPEGGWAIFPSKLFSTFIKRISINLYASDVANLPIVFFFFLNEDLLMLLLFYGREESIDCDHA